MSDEFCGAERLGYAPCEALASGPSVRIWTGRSASDEVDVPLCRDHRERLDIDADSGEAA